MPSDVTLTSSLTGQSGQDGIIIDADDIGIDLNGFSLIGVSGAANGIDGTQCRWRNKSI